MSAFAIAMELDCKGLNCPLPILKTKKAIDGLSVGDILKVITTDPGSVNDMSSWAKRTGHDLVGHETEAEVNTFFIKKN